MMLVQIVMLNLLIAFMAQSLGQLRTNAQLMAHFERAILVIEQEQMLMSRKALENRRKQRAAARKSSETGLKRTLRALHTRLGSTQEWFESCCPAFAPPTQEAVGPRWLHVLLPSESVSDGKAGAAAPPPPPKAAPAATKTNDELQQWLAVQLGSLEARLMEHIQQANGGGAKKAE